MGGMGGGARREAGGNEEVRLGASRYDGGLSWEPRAEELEGRLGSDPASHPEPELDLCRTVVPMRQLAGGLLSGDVTLQMWSLRMGWYCEPRSCLWNQD